MTKGLNILIVLMIAFNFFAVFGLINSVKADTISNFGFEDDPLDTPYTHTHNGVSIATTWEANEFEIDSNAYEGDKSFLVDQCGIQFWNYSFSSGFLTNWSIMWDYNDIGDYLQMAFYNSNYWSGNISHAEDDAFLFFFQNADAWKMYNHDKETKSLGALTTSFQRFYVQITDNDTIEIGQNNIVTSGATITPRNVSYNLTKNPIDMIVFWTTQSPNVNFDKHIFTRSPAYGLTEEDEGEVTDGTIYFQLYNIEDGNPISFGMTYAPPDAITFMATFPYIISDIVPLNYNWEVDQGRIKLTDLDFTEGTIYTFYFSGINNGLEKFEYTIYTYYGSVEKRGFFSPKTYNQAIYEGQTYSVYLYPTDYTDGVNYSWCEDNEYIQICLNKRVYDFGETIRCKFRFKSQKMLNNGLPSYNWQLRMVKRTDMIMNVLASTPFVNYLRQDAGDFDFNNNWQNVQWQLIEHNDYGYKKYFAKYLCAMFHPYEPFGTNYNLCKIPFWCTGDEFSPSGSISANPNPVTLGQIVTISWTANNSGKVKIASPFGTDNNPNYVKSQPFEYSDATRYFNFTPDSIGNYNVELYVDGIETGNASDMPVDTLVLRVNPKTGEEGEHGQFGFGVAYLWTPAYRLVAGLDNASIYYRTYKNDSQLFVYSPRGETTSYSTTCSNWSDNVHNFHLPNWAQIGTWNITFLAGHLNGTNVTLKSSFNIINEEGNWIQFGKNVFYDNEPFTIYLKHDYRISLTFYKDNVAQGEDIIFGKGEHDGEEITINPEYVNPSAGYWRVEMNRINELNRIYKLAEWECTVKPAPIKGLEGGAWGGNLATFMANIDPTIRAIMGLALCLSMLLIPFPIVKSMKRPINIPPIMYACLFFSGVVISYILTFFGLEIMFFLCSMTGLIIVGLYFMGKRSSPSAEA